MVDSLRYGIIGCAGIGNTHANAVKTADTAELVACSDIDDAAAKQFADKYNVPEYFTYASNMIEKADLDAVSVCTPSGTHSQVTIEAAEAGAHILCEKPLDVYAKRVDTMIEACEEAGVTLAGVFQERFDPDVRQAKRIIESGELGDPIIGETAVKWFRPQFYYDSAEWRGSRDMDGGVLMNQAIHSIDTLQWLMSGVTEVEAFTDSLSRDFECEDSAVVALRFENGALGTIRATTAVKGGRDRTEINGTEGSLILDNRGDGIIDLQIGTGEESRFSAKTEQQEVDGIPHEFGSGHPGVVHDFIAAIQNDREPEVPASEARKALDVILAVYESAKTGEKITVTH